MQRMRFMFAMDGERPSALPWDHDASADRTIADVQTSQKPSDSVLARSMRELSRCPMQHC